LIPFGEKTFRCEISGIADEAPISSAPPEQAPRNQEMLRVKAIENVHGSLGQRRPFAKQSALILSSLYPASVTAVTSATLSEGERGEGTVKEQHFCGVTYVAVYYSSS
jgi:hypothetical protein